MKMRHARTNGAKKALYRKLVAEHRGWQITALKEAISRLSTADLAKAAASAIARAFSGIRIRRLR